MVPQEWLTHAPQPRPLRGNQQWNVFLSYRSINRPWVLNLYDVLIETGHKVFLDQYVLTPGGELITQLQDGLDSSQAAILIWSTSTRDSDWVRKEYNALETKATEDKEFFFVPIKIDSSDLPLFARNRIFLDFSGYPDGPNGGDLIRLLHGIVGKPLSPEAVRFAEEQNAATKQSIIEIKAAIKNGNINKLVQLSLEQTLPWKTSAAIGCSVAEGLIKLKANDEAITLLDRLTNEFPKAIRPKQLISLALARRGNEGDLEKAQDILGCLYQDNNMDPETMGIYGRTWMDRYEKSNDINDLIQSRDLYAEAFERSPDDYYTGINAAAKSIFIGTEKDIAAGMNYAARVQELVGTKPTPGDYWKTATVAEVLLIQKKYDEAATMYELALSYGRKETGSLESSRKQIERLLEKLKPSSEEKEKILAVVTM